MANELTNSVISSSSRLFSLISDYFDTIIPDLAANIANTHSHPSFLSSTLATKTGTLNSLCAVSFSYLRSVYTWSVRNPLKSSAYLVLSLLVLYPSLSLIQDLFVSVFSSLTPFSTSSSSSSRRKKRMRWPKSKKREGKITVGLLNRANDCFANSNLQALGSVRTLYEYCVQMSDLVPQPGMEQMYQHLVSANQKEEKSTRRVAATNLTTGPLEITMALKDEIAQLNEPILEHKDLDPWAFLRVIEKFYNSRISRSQHDAHELLHLILETLEIEHRRIQTFYRSLREIAVRHYEEEKNEKGKKDAEGEAPMKSDTSASNETGNPKCIRPETIDKLLRNIPFFPFKGTTRDQITCSRCGYVPSSATSTFIVLSLVVPQKNRATLNDLLVEFGKPEHILDYGCTNCRLVEFVKRLKYSINSSKTSEKTRFHHAELLRQVEPYLQAPATLPQALEDMLPKDVTSTIAKATNFDTLPEILSIHLNRSIFWGYGASRNSCKVSIPEYLELFEEGKQVQQQDLVNANGESKNGKAGGASSTTLLEKKLGSLLSGRRKVQYILVAIIRHSGTHHAGHYECFRRKNLKWWKTHLPMYGHSNNQGDFQSRGNKNGAVSATGSTTTGSSLPVFVKHGGSGSKSVDLASQASSKSPSNTVYAPSSSSSSSSATGNGNGSVGHNDDHDSTKTHRREGSSFSNSLRIRRSRSQSNGDSNKTSNSDSVHSPTTNNTTNGHRHQQSDGYNSVKSQPSQQPSVPQSPTPTSSYSSSSWFFGFGFSSISSAFSSGNHNVAPATTTTTTTTTSASTPASPSSTLTNNTNNANNSANQNGYKQQSIDNSTTNVSSPVNGSLNNSQRHNSYQSTEQASQSAPTSSTYSSSSSSSSSSSYSEILPPSITNDWWQISDESSWEKSMKDVLRDESGAYLLFYERIGGNGGIGNGITGLGNGGINGVGIGNMNVSMK